MTVSVSRSLTVFFTFEEIFALTYDVQYRFGYSHLAYLSIPVPSDYLFYNAGVNGSPVFPGEA